MGLLRIRKIVESAELSAARFDMSRRQAQTLKSYGNSPSVLSPEQKKEIITYFRPFCRVNTHSHNYYLLQTGHYDKRYIPADLYYNYIDRYYNDVSESKYIDNKCLYRKLFPGIHQPETLAYRMNGFWYDPSDRLISEKEAIARARETACFLKTASGSYGGQGVTFLPENSDLGSILPQYGIRDMILQYPVRQHGALAQINDSSVNTIRVVSLLDRDGSVDILASLFRAGQQGSRVDNAHSGGISCGITKDGMLKKVAYTYNECVGEYHPDSKVRFEGYMIPSYEEILEQVKRAHLMIPHFRMVFWDFSVDDGGKPLLIEANLSRGGIIGLQMSNGPLFGDRTESVLKEVFNK